jgi:hypothetical protein
MKFSSIDLAHFASYNTYRNTERGKPMNQINLDITANSALPLLDLTKYTDGTSALAYGQPQTAYDISKRGNRMKPTDISMSKIQLTAKQKNDFNSQLKIAVYNQLFKNGFLSSAQLDTLIARERSSAKAADYGRN